MRSFKRRMLIRQHAGVRRLVYYGADRPAYLQIADELRDRIISGQLAVGERVPSGADIARQFEVSREVARHALAVLKAEGLTDSRYGRGTFVRPRPEIRRRSQSWYERPPDGEPTSPTTRAVLADGGTPSWNHSSQRVEADSQTAARLGIAAGARVMRTEYVFRADTTPFQLSTSWEPLDLTAGTDVEWPEDGAMVGVVARYDHIGIHVDTVDELVTARMPTQTEQQLLNLPPGVPVMVIVRTYRSEGRAVETADIVVPGDRTELHYGIAVR